MQNDALSIYTTVIQIVTVEEIEIYVFVILELSGRHKDDSEDESDVEEGQNEIQPEHFEEEIKIDPRDETAFNAFMNTTVGPRKTLADLVR